MSTRRTLFFAFSAIASLTVEGLKANPVVPGVSLITEGPAKGHSAYDDATNQMVPVYVDAITLQQAMVAAQTYANGLRVKAEHFSGVLEVCGFLNSFRIDGIKLRGDLNLFRTFTVFEHLCSLIVTIPDTFGLSIDFAGEPEIRDGKAFARVTEIYSCDLVDEPAANEGGMFNARRERSFDNRRNSMSENTPPPPTPPAPPTPTAPPAPPAASPTLEEITQLLTTTIDAAIAPIKTDLAALTTKVSGLEASLNAAADSEAAPAAFRALRGDLANITTKLSRRLGIEFAARAGATPSEGNSPDPNAAKAHEVPARDAWSAQFSN